MPQQKNTLRIIGGEYRGRRLHFPDAPGLRPTADRVRETLFNWLQGKVRGRRVLDLFAGSGALGIEALSRGAAEVVFVEKARAAAQQLRNNVQQLQATERSTVHWMDAQTYLHQVDAHFDLIFLDPPFADDLLPDICQQLQKYACLSEIAWVYVEQDAKQIWPKWPIGWQVHREGHAGQAKCCLLTNQRSPDGV